MIMEVSVKCALSHHDVISHLTCEVLAFVAFQRGQIPSPLQQLGDFVSKATATSSSSSNLTQTEIKKAATFVEQFQAVKEDITALFASLPSSSLLPRTVCVLLGSSLFTPKEVFLVDLRYPPPNPDGKPVAPEVSQIKEATRKLLRNMVAAIPEQGGLPDPLRMHLLFLGPREARYPHCTPKQNISPDKPAARKLVVRVGLRGAEEHEEKEERIDDNDQLWYLFNQTLQGYRMG